MLSTGELQALCSYTILTLFTIESVLVPDVWPISVEPRPFDTADEIYSLERRPMQIFQNPAGHGKAGEVWLVDGILKFLRLTGTHARASNSRTDETPQTTATTFVPQRRLVEVEIMQVICYIYTREVSGSRIWAEANFNPRNRITFADGFQVFNAFNRLTFLNPRTGKVLSSTNVAYNVELRAKIPSVRLHQISKAIEATGVLLQKTKGFEYNAEDLCFISAHACEVPRVRVVMEELCVTREGLEHFVGTSNALAVVWNCREFRAFIEMGQ